jgi:hypothetical protein
MGLREYAILFLDRNAEAVKLICCGLESLRANEVFVGMAL